MSVRKSLDDSLFDSIIAEVMPQQMSKIGLAITDLAKKDPTFRRAIQQIKPERPTPPTPPGREEDEIDLDDIDPNILRSLDRASQRGQIELPEAIPDLPDALGDLARELMEPDASGSEAILLSVAEFYELDPEHLRRVFLAQKKVGSLQDWRNGMRMESRKAAPTNQLKENAKKFGILYEDFEAAMRRTLKRIRTNFSEDKAEKFKKLMAKEATKNPRKFVAWLGVRDKILSEKYPNFKRLKARLKE